MSTTPAMQVATVTINPDRAALTFNFTTPFQGPLFIGLMSINLVPTLKGVTGKIKPGKDGTHGGTSNVQMDQPHFDPILKFVDEHLVETIFVQLKYDEQTLVPLEVLLSAKAAAAPAA